MCFRELSPSQLLSYPNPATSSPQIILPSPSLHFFAVRELGGLLCCLTGGGHKLSWVPGGIPVSFRARMPDRNDPSSWLPGCV